MKSREVPVYDDPLSPLKKRIKTQEELKKEEEANKAKVVEALGEDEEEE